MSQNKFRGMGIALITPFLPDGNVDFDALKRLVAFQIEQGADFLCILATTGETPTLSLEEKRAIKACLIETVNKRIPILIGCGGNNTKAVVEEIKTTNWDGIDGILSVCPMYNKPTQEGLYQHFAAIAKASPLPVVLYNVPGRTGVNLQAATTVRLARDFDNIVAVKEASGNISQIDYILKNKPSCFDVISGDDGITYPLIMMGAVGVISVLGNAVPGDLSRMVRLALQGDYTSALRFHQKFVELIDLLFVDGNPAGIKAMLASMGMVQNVLRLPLVPARATTYQQIEQITKTL